MQQRLLSFYFKDTIASTQYACDLLVVATYQIMPVYRFAVCLFKNSFCTRNDANFAHTRFNKTVYCSLKMSVYANQNNHLKA